MSSAPSSQSAERAVQPNSRAGVNNMSSQQHADTKPSKELHASLPDRSRNTTIDDSQTPNPDFLNLVPLPDRSLQEKASGGPTSSSPHHATMSQASGNTSRPDVLAEFAKPEEYPLLDFAPPIPGVNDNEVLYQSSTKAARKEKFLFKKKDTSRDYSNHSRAHPSTPFHILAEIYTVEGEEIGLREFSHQLKDGRMCTFVRDVYGTRRIPGSGMPVSFSNYFPKLAPISTPTMKTVSSSCYSRKAASAAATAAITSSVPNLGSDDPHTILPAAKKASLNPLSTGLVWSNSQRQFNIMTRAADTAAPFSSSMVQASMDGISSPPAGRASSCVGNQFDAMASRTNAYSPSSFGCSGLRAVTVDQARPSQPQKEHELQDDLVEESHGSINEDEVSTDEALSDDDDDLDIEDRE